MWVTKRSVVASLGVTGVLACSVLAEKNLCRDSGDCLPWRVCDHGQCASSLAVSEAGVEGTDAARPLDGGVGCSADERYVVLRASRASPLIVFGFDGDHLAPVWPTGFVVGTSGALPSGGDSSQPAGLLLTDRFLVATAQAVYAVNHSTLVSEDVTASQRTVGAQMQNMVWLEPHLLGFAEGVTLINPGSTWTVDSSVDAGTSYHGVTLMPWDGGTLALALGTESVEMWSVEGGKPIQIDTVSRPALGGFADSNERRALAYDTTTAWMVVGQTGGLATLNPGTGLMSWDGGLAWRAPDGGSHPHAAVVQDGKLWVATNAYLYGLNMGRGTVTEREKVRLPAGSETVDLAMACEHVLVLTRSQLLAFDAQSLGTSAVAIAQNDLEASEFERLVVAQRTELNLVGDAPQGL
jgi:hypothetical protein